MKLLEGKTAIITGASRGIGKGIAYVFAQQGANVAFTYSSSVEAANALETELNALGIKAKGYKSNAADFNEAQKLVDDVMAEFGNVDILLRKGNSDGISWGQLSVVADNGKLQAGNPAPVVDLLDPKYPDGRIFLFYNTGNNHEGEVRKGNGRTGHQYYSLASYRTLQPSSRVLLRA